MEWCILVCSEKGIKDRFGEPGALACYLGCRISANSCLEGDQRSLLAILWTGWIRLWEFEGFSLGSIFRMQADGPRRPSLRHFETGLDVLYMKPEHGDWILPQKRGLKGPIHSR